MVLDDTGTWARLVATRIPASDDAPPTKDGANANANSKAVENLNSKVDKLIELLKKQ